MARTSLQNIQQQILIKLLSAESLRYSEARPENIENDLYNYHLQFLVQKGLVKKENDRYSLTVDGKYFVGEKEPLSPLGRKADLFKLNVLTIVCDYSKKPIQILNQDRKRQPFYGRIGIMGGTIRKGEFALDAAKRKLLEETGLEGEFQLIGLLRKVTLGPEGNLFSDILYHLALATSFRGEIQNTRYGDNFWVDINTGIKNEANAVVHSDTVVNVLQTIKENNGYTKKDIFYLDEVQQIVEIR